MAEFWHPTGRSHHRHHGLGAGRGCGRGTSRLGDPLDRPVPAPDRAPYWVLVTAGLGLLIGLLAMGYQLVTGNSFSQVLFSGQDALPDLVSAHATDYSLAVLIMLIACKALAYGLSLSAFRGGPVFPLMFIGATLGIAASGLPGMDLAPAIGMGIGAMCAAMLRLPMTSTLLATLLLGADGLSVTPEVIVAVVVAFVVTNVLPVPGPKEPTLAPADTRPAAPPPAPATA